MAQVKGADDLAALIGDIYDAATDRSRWAGLMPRLTAALSGTSAVMFSPGPSQTDSVVRATHGIDPNFQSLYERHYCQHDILLSKVAELGLIRAGWTACCDEYLDRKLLERSTYYNEFLKPCGTGGALCAVLLDETILPGAPPTALSVYRPPESPLFDARALELAKLLAPHLQRALLIHWRLTFAEVRAQTSEAVLDRLEHGVMQLSTDGRVLYANHAASQSLGTGRAAAHRARRAHHAHAGLRLTPALPASAGKKRHRRTAARPGPGRQTGHTARRHAAAPGIRHEVASRDSCSRAARGCRGSHLDPRRTSCLRLRPHRRGDPRPGASRHRPISSGDCEIARHPHPNRAQPAQKHLPEDRRARTARIAGAHQQAASSERHPRAAMAVGPTRES